MLRQLGVGRPASSRKPQALGQSEIGSRQLETAGPATRARRARRAYGGVGPEILRAGFERLVADLAGQDRRVLHLAHDYRPRNSLGERPTDMEPVRPRIAVSDVSAIPDVAIKESQTDVAAVPAGPAGVGIAPSGFAPLAPLSLTAARKPVTIWCRIGFVTRPPASFVAQVALRRRVAGRVRRTQLSRRRQVGWSGRHPE